MTVKVGQIYNSDEGIYVISKVRFDAVVDVNWSYVIYNDGTSECWSDYFISKYSKLIAEYPTWQQAVNSPEFKGENDG